MKKDFESVFLFFKHLNPYKVKIEYVAGIPNLNKTFVAGIKLEDQSLIFTDYYSKNKIVEIKRNDILNICVEDDTTIESIVGLKRMLLVGIFAFAWKKRKTNPLAFLVIEYKDEVSGSEKAIFQSTSKEAFQNLNNLKYNLVTFWQYVDEFGDDYKKQIQNFESTHNTAVEKETEHVKKVFLIIFIIVICLIVFYMILS